ncbi:MAG: PilZ domain-containing protein [Desulfobulbaceae bacterium]
METVKAFVRENDTVTIVCPVCKTPKNAAVGSFRDKSHYLKVRCSCENVFTVHLDFRQHYRKGTDLSGTFRSITPPGMGGDIHIKDISVSGIGFTVNGMQFLERGHTLILTFTLDDKKKTTLSKEVVVRSVQGDFVGCRFVETKAYEKELGFYLKS